MLDKTTVEFCLKYYNAKIYGYYTHNTTTNRGYILYRAREGTDRESLYKDINRVITKQLIGKNHYYELLLDVIKNKNLFSLIKQYLVAVAMDKPEKRAELDTSVLKMLERVYTDILEILKEKDEILKNKIYIFAMEKDVTAPIIHEILKKGYTDAAKLRFILNPMYSFYQFSTIAKAIADGLTAEELCLIARPDLARNYMEYVIDWIKLYKKVYETESSELFIPFASRIINDAIDNGLDCRQWEQINYKVRTAIAEKALTFQIDNIDDIIYQIQSKNTAGKL